METITLTYEQLETIKNALRFQFDSPKVDKYTSLALSEAMASINQDSFLEMRSDLISEGVINE